MSTSSFTVSNNTIILGQSVTFTDTSENATSWTWIFGDGTISQIQNPSHVYNNVGNYDVILITYGSTDFKYSYKTISVIAAIPNPVITIQTLQSNRNANKPITFLGTSTTSVTSWLWLFGDGFVSTLQNPTHTYTSSGSYNVALFAKGLGGFNITSTVLNISLSPPVASFNSLLLNISNQAITFTDTSINNPTSWLWDFGDGTTSILQNPTHVYKGGVYSVKLTVTNSNGSSSITKTITIRDIIPVANFNISSITANINQSIIFTDISTNNPTSWFWNFGDGTTSALQNPTHYYSRSGIFTITLLAKNSAGTSIYRKQITISTVAFDSMNIDQAISDVAQLTTLAFDGFAMITGNLYAQSFFPPGKVADYTGFQYMRDNTINGLGHNTDFLTKCALNVLYILNDSQFNKLVDLAKIQVDTINSYALNRYPIMKAFRRLLDNNLPVGSTGLNLNSIKLASKKLYRIDGQISFERANLYADIIKGMIANNTVCNYNSNMTQLTFLNNMKAGYLAWPTLTSQQMDIIQTRMRDLSHDVNVGVMTYAGDICSWYTGSVTADIYFCPERHGTYYGGFYLKDAPAVGVPGYQISTTVTATIGVALTDASKGYVTSDQTIPMRNLLNLQRSNLTNIISIRTQIATLLRSLLSSSTNSSNVLNQILTLSETYGELDGTNNYYYMNAINQTYKLLSSTQISRLMSLRSSLLSGTYENGTPFNFTTCQNPYLYSEIITNLSTLDNYISDEVTNLLFFEPV